MLLVSRKTVMFFKYLRAHVMINLCIRALSYATFLFLKENLMQQVSVSI